MNTPASCFLIDDLSRICEIVDGKNASFSDGYRYKMAESGNSVHRIDGGGFVDGEFTAHASRDDLMAAIASVPGPR